MAHLPGNRIGILPFLSFLGYQKESSVQRIAGRSRRPRGAVFPADEDALRNSPRPKRCIGNGPPGVQGWQGSNSSARSLQRDEPVGGARPYNANAPKRMAVDRCVQLCYARRLSFSLSWSDRSNDCTMNELATMRIGPLGLLSLWASGLLGRTDEYRRVEQDAYALLTGNEFPNAAFGMRVQAARDSKRVVQVGTTAGVFVFGKSAVPLSLRQRLPRARLGIQPP